jgi:hypothetical protein
MNAVFLAEMPKEIWKERARQRVLRELRILNMEEVFSGAERANCSLEK